jgi:hypothetical protein
METKGRKADVAACAEMGGRLYARAMVVKVVMSGVLL